MEPHPIAVIKRSAQDSVMELLIAALLVAILGALAQLGTDSRDADPRAIQPAWYPLQPREPAALGDPGGVFARRPARTVDGGTIRRQPRRVRCSAPIGDGNLSPPPAINGATEDRVPMSIRVVDARPSSAEGGDRTIRPWTSCSFSP